MNKHVKSAPNYSMKRFTTQSLSLDLKFLKSRNIIVKLLVSFLLIQLTQFQSVFSQQTEASSFEKAVDFLPPPPDASAVIKYANASLNKNTGAPNVNIPLYTLKGIKLSTSVSLGYSSTGIKVDELASRVGMGWALSAGGVITRTVRGQPDESHQREYPNQPVGFNWATYTYMQRIAQAAPGGGRDAEPDLYNFSFDGYSGSFVTDGADNPFLINKSGVKIKSPLTGDTWDFKIITPEGTSYYFGGSNAVEKSKRTQTCGKTFDLYLTTAYYLTKIEALNGESITFTYLQNQYSYASSISETMLGATSGNGGTVSCPVISRKCINITHVQGVLLHHITAINGEIIFQYTSRQDCDDALVSKVSFMSFNKVMGSYDLSYVNQNSNAVYNNTSNQYLDGVNKTPYLVALVENSSDNSLNKSHYFSYDSPGRRPSRLSYSQDHWGYFNGKNNSTLLPKLGGLNNVAFPNATADRNPDFEFSKMGLLNKIVYPTGAINMIFYEPNTFHETSDNDFRNLHNLSCNVTGIGTGHPWQTNTKTKSFSIDNAQVIDIIINCDSNSTYEYQHNLGTVTLKNETGAVVKFEQCRPTDIQPRNLTCFLSAGQYTLEISANGSEITTSVTVKFEPVSHLSTQIEKILGGSRVKRIITTNPNDKPIVKKYYYGTYDDLNTSSMSQLNGHPRYEMLQWCQGGENGSNWQMPVLYASSLLNLGFYSNGYVSYNSVVESIGDNFEGGGIETRFYTHCDGLGEVVNLYGGDIINSPFTNWSSIDNGKISSETLLKKLPDGSLKPVKKTEYYYNNKLEEEDILYGYNVVQHSSVVSSADTLCDVSINPNAFASCASVLGLMLSNYDMVKYSIFSSWVVPERTVETVLDENGENPVVNELYYYYDNASHFELTRTSITNSENKIVQTIFKYPHDFNTIPVYGEMVEKNYISPVIKRSIEEASDPNAIIPISDEQFDFVKLGADYYIASIKKSSKGNILDVEGTIDFRDLYGNVIQYTDKTGLVTSVLLGYNYQYPVAKIIGASYETVQSELTVTPQELLALNDEEALKITLNELRINMPSAIVTSFTYKYGVGVSSVTDPNGKTNSYEYDSFGRLIYLKDQDGNYVKKNEYIYALTSPGMNIPVYTNEMVGQSMQCQTCIAGYAPVAPVTYVVPYGKYYSLKSQQEADSLALADIQEFGQEYANSKGVCSNTTSCSGMGYKFIGCGCELGHFENITCSQLNTDGTWTNYKNYSYSDGSTASFEIPMPACTGVDKKMIDCQCETAKRVCESPPIVNGNDSYTVSFRYKWSDNSLSTQVFTETITCSGPDKKIVNCNCETAEKIYTTSVQCTTNGTTQCCHLNQWLCTFHYKWSDNSTSDQNNPFTECNSADCMNPYLGL